MADSSDICESCVHKSICKYSEWYKEFAKKVVDYQREMLKSEFYGLSYLNMTLANPVCNVYRTNIVPRKLK